MYPSQVCPFFFKCIRIVIGGIYPHTYVRIYFGYGRKEDSEQHRLTKSSNAFAAGSNLKVFSLSFNSRVVNAFHKKVFLEVNLTPCLV